MNRLVIGIALTAVLFSAGCKHLATHGASIEKNGPPQPVQISGPGIDAAEPAIAPARDGSFYVAWVNHDAKQADVMLARFNDAGEIQGSAVRVNRQAGAATAWRGDQPSLAVAPDGAVHVLWTARVDAGSRHTRSGGPGCAMADFRDSRD